MVLFTLLDEGHMNKITESTTKVTDTIPLKRLQ